MKVKTAKILAVAGLVSIIIVTAGAFGQGTKRLEFDVATLRAVEPRPAESININLGTIRNGTVTLGNVTLNECIKFAYEIGSDAQIVGPEWIKDREVRFNIVGQTPHDAPPDQVHQMMQTLLAERLKLAIHHEKRDLPFLALVVGKNGPKLPPAGDAVPVTVGAGRIISPSMPMNMLASLIARFERQTVVDLTELKGPFRVNLTWTPDALRNLARADGGPVSVNGQTVDVYGPSLYTAIQDQLGLRLESRKGPLDVIVVDRAEKVPTDN